MIGRTNALTIISAGGGGVLNPWDDVCFYDVDGTLYKTMTKEEFAELDSLPALPDHTDDGLYADGWYWSPFERQNQTLATFKAYLADVGYLDLAAEYTCSDSKIEIELTDVLTIYLHLNFTITTANAVTLNVDWGDGTSDSYASGSQQTKHFSHTYPSAGKYTIGLSGEVTSSSGGFYNVQLNYLPTAYSSSSSSSGLNGTDIVKKVIIGDSFPNKSISNCHFTFIKAKDFKYFYSTLRTTSSSAYRSMIGQFVGQFDHHVCFRELCFRPVNATTNAPYTSTLIKETKPVMSWMDSSVFANCIRYCLHNEQDINFKNMTNQFKIKVPTNWRNYNGNNNFITYGSYLGRAITSLDCGNTGTFTSVPYDLQNVLEVKLNDLIDLSGNYCFRNCYILKEIEIPATVTAIGNQCFQNLYGLQKLKFLASTPATVGTNCWTNLPTNCKIYVPAGSLAAYTSAANYPSSSTYQYIEY